jgi:DNA-binding CsgD family transcriptional regulator
VQVLRYPDVSLPVADSLTNVQERIRRILEVDQFTGQQGAVTFVSGRRRYVCRPFLLEAGARPHMVTILLERQPSDSPGLSPLIRRFHLSPRESKTIRYISQGLTTKEIAQRMSVSPDTIKQFVRLMMSKMGVTTRSGIVGKRIAG